MAKWCFQALQEKPVGALLQFTPLSSILMANEGLSKVEWKQHS